MARSRSRSRERNRSRSGSRERRRSRSRSRSRERRQRRRFEEPDPNSAVVQMQALAAVQAQAQLQRQLALQANPLLGTVNAPSAVVVKPAASATEEAAKRKARELYIGNLSVGNTTSEQIRDIFNGALAGMVADPMKEPPVAEVKMDPQGRFAFVELRTEELATIGLSLTGTELNGRGMKIGRPNGYIAPAGDTVAQTKLAQAAALAAKLGGGITNVVLLEGLLPAVALRDESERRTVMEMVFEEAAKCGRVLGVAAPLPPPYAPDSEPCRVYVKYKGSEEAQRLKEMMNGRLFDDNTVTATYSTDLDFSRARVGDWVVEGQDAPAPLASAMSGGVALPGPPPSGGLTGAPIVMHF